MAGTIDSDCLWAGVCPVAFQLFAGGGTGIGNPRTGTESSGWRRNHTGSLNGRNALARQRGDGVNFVVLFNKRPLTGSSYASQMRTILDGLIDVTTNWPSVGDGAMHEYTNSPGDEVGFHRIRVR